MHPTEFFERWNGETTEELLALEGRFRTDSIVLAFEEALQRKRQGTPLTREETFVLALESYEREVNNGGAHQFFVNASVEFAPVVVDALEAVGCPVSAGTMREALSALLPSGVVTAAAAEEAARERYDEVRAALERCDDAFFGAGEPIAENLLAFIRRHADRVRVGLQ